MSLKRGKVSVYRACFADFLKLFVPGFINPADWSIERATNRLSQCNWQRDTVRASDRGRRTHRTGREKLAEEKEKRIQKPGKDKERENPRGGREPSGQRKRIKNKTKLKSEVFRRTWDWEKTFKDTGDNFSSKLPFIIQCSHFSSGKGDCLAKGKKGHPFFSSLSPHTPWSPPCIPVWPPTSFAPLVKNPWFFTLKIWPSCAPPCRKRLQKPLCICDVQSGFCGIWGKGSEPVLNVIFSSGAPRFFHRKSMQMIELLHQGGQWEQRS